MIDNTFATPVHQNPVTLCLDVVVHSGTKYLGGHAVAQTQMRGFGAMLAFEVKAGLVTADAVQRRLKLIRPAASLGGVETTICAPAQTSHGKMSRADRERLGITDALLRLSVGIEHHEDLIADLSQAPG